MDEKYKFDPYVPQIIYFQVNNTLYCPFTIEH